MTKCVAMIVINLVTPKAAAKRDLLFNKPASESCLGLGFSTLSWPVFVSSVIAWQRQAMTYLEFKIRPRFHSIISWTVFVVSVTAWHRQTLPHVEFKTRPRFHPI